MRVFVSEVLLSDADPEIVVAALIIGEVEVMVMSGSCPPAGIGPGCEHNRPVVQVHPLPVALAVENGANS